MKVLGKVFAALSLVACLLGQPTYADIVVEKDAIGPVALGIGAVGGFLLIAAVIAIIWTISVAVIKSIRKKNVSK